MLIHRYLWSTFLVVVLLASTAVAAIDKGGDLPRAIPHDDTSTFAIGNLTHKFPLDTIQVPLTLDTSNDVTWIENRVTWDDADLVLVNITTGDGVPSSATLDTESVSTDTVQFHIYDSGNSFSVGSEPVVYLHFEVQCYGYGVWTGVEFDGGDAHNFYISSGAPAAPDRVNGLVGTKRIDYLAVWGSSETAYSGDQDIPWTGIFYQVVPGRLKAATLTYDHTALEVLSIEPLPALGEGATATIESDVGGTLELSFDGPVIAPGQVDLYLVHFAVLDDRDDYAAVLQFIAGTCETECGNEITPFWLWSGSITIPNHTAAVDLGEVRPVYTASYYDLPVIMDSNFPVNAYELWLEFPHNDELELTGVVAVGGYAVPSAVVDTNSTPAKININNGGATNYELTQPTTVFKLRVAPLASFPVDKKWDFDWDSTNPENAIQYNMDLPGLHYADITSYDTGYIWLKSSGGGGNPNPCCPALYVWNGVRFTLENTILAECDGKRVTHDVTDYYRVAGFVAQEGDELRFQIREDANAVSSFSDFELLVVDHPERKPVYVAEDGTIMTTGQPFSLSWARDHKGNDILEELSAMDEFVYLSTEDGWFDVSLGRLQNDQIDKFAASINDAQQKGKICDDERRAQGFELERDRKLRISVQKADGSWKMIAENDARHIPTRQATIITPDMIDPGCELVLRYSWEGYYRIDALEFNVAEPFTGKIAHPGLWDAAHNEAGGVLGRLGDNPVEPLVLKTGETIDLVFDASELVPVGPGFVREYIFVATGRYGELEAADEAVSARGWALDANVPNPFNPSTTIGYNLVTQAHVELSIYDVSGALVRTLVSGTQSAGEKSVAWDGRSNAGNAMASGVYFFRLKTSEYVQTRKMILIK